MPPEQDKTVLTRRGLRIGAAAGGVALVAIVVFGITARRMADARLSEWTENQATPYVSIAQPDTRSRKSTIELPGRLEAYSQAQIYARVPGYIKEWKADIGTAVKAGQLLAEIDAPDLDQQIMQAQADLGNAEANAVLAKANLERGQSLIASGAVSKRDLEQREADAASRAALVKSAQANLDRLRVLEKYKRITAPFDGIVTSRATDVGALINAGAGGGPALFVVSDTKRLRAYVNVPQSYVPSVKIGTKAQLTVPEYRARTFVATVEASAQSVDSASGTTRMQLGIDNPNGELMTGAFANVRLELTSSEIAIHVPASALIFDQGGLRVATVDHDNKIVLKTVSIARDFGKEVEIGSGLSPDDRVVETPPDGIASGDVVRIAQPGNADKALATR